MDVIRETTDKAPSVIGDFDGDSRVQAIAALFRPIEAKPPNRFLTWIKTTFRKPAIS